MTYRKSKESVRDCTAECGRGPRSFDTPSLLEIGCYWNVHDQFIFVDVLLNKTGGGGGGGEICRASFELKT